MRLEFSLFPLFSTEEHWVATDPAEAPCLLAQPARLLVEPFLLSPEQQQEIHNEHVKFT